MPPLLQPAALILRHTLGLIHREMAPITSQKSGLKHLGIYIYFDMYLYLFLSFLRQKKNAILFILTKFAQASEFVDNIFSQVLF